MRCLRGSVTSAGGRRAISRIVAMARTCLSLVGVALGLVQEGTNAWVCTKAEHGTGRLFLDPAKHRDSLAGV